MNNKLRPVTTPPSRPPLALIAVSTVAALAAAAYLGARAVALHPHEAPAVTPSIVVRGDLRCWELGTETMHADGLVTIPAEKILKIDESQGTTLWIFDNCLVEQKKEGRRK